MRVVLSCALAAASIAGAAFAAGETGVMPGPEMPVASGGGDTLAVFYSGDGGWAAIDKGVSQGLVAKGVPVLGVSSIRYFWDQKTPAAAAADLATAIERYGRAWKAPKVVLVGYSFGASPLPLLVAHLPDPVRKRVRMVAMISPDALAELRFRPTDWIGHTAKDAMPVADALRTIPEVPVVCLYGDQEKGSACPGFGGLVHPVRLSGDHHFGGRYPELAVTILQALGAIGRTGA